jgi:hypothetical protein
MAEQMQYIFIYIYISVLMVLIICGQLALEMGNVTPKKYFKYGLMMAGFICEVLFNR